MQLLLGWGSALRADVPGQEEVPGFGEVAAKPEQEWLWSRSVFSVQVINCLIVTIGCLGGNYERVLH